jgi:hypothetical protein
MTITATITLPSPGTDTGPFDLKSNVDSYASIFDPGVPRSSFLTGYTSNVVPDGTTIIRVQSSNLLCNNYIDLAISGLPPATTTTTTSTTTTSTTTTTTSLPYAQYQVEYYPPSGMLTGITYFSYVDCSGVTVNSNVGNESPFPPSRQVCARVGTVTLTGGDNTATIIEGFPDCCVSSCTAVSYSYDATSYITACSGGMYGDYYLDTLTLALWNDNLSGTCSGTNAAIGYYSDGTDFYYYDGDMLNLGGSCAPLSPGDVTVFARNTVTSGIDVEIGYSINYGFWFTLSSGDLTTTLTSKGTISAPGGANVRIGVRRADTATALGFNDAPSTSTYPYCGWNSNPYVISEINGNVTVNLKVNINGGTPSGCST